VCLEFKNLAAHKGRMLFSACFAGSGRFHRRACAFTLVELLVVVAIISLLISILLPSLGRARSVANFAICQQQLKNWGIGFQIYTATYDEYLPHIDGLDRDDSPADRCGWVDVIPPLIGFTPWRDHALYERPGADSFFQCVSAEPCGSGYSYKPERDGYFSYAMNSCLELDADCNPPASMIPMPSFLRTGLITTPSRVVMLFDQLLDPTHGYGGNEINRSAGKYCGAYPRDFAVRHKMGKQKGGSILYCDYSVRWTESVWKDTWPEKMYYPPRDDPDWFPYLP